MYKKNSRLLLVLVIMMVLSITGCGTPTLSPQQQSNEKNYQSHLKDDAGHIATAFSDLTSDMSTINEYNIVSKKSSMAASLALIITYEEDIKKTIPPDKTYKAGQDLLNKGADTMVQGCNDFAKAIGTLDSDLLKKAINEMTTSTDDSASGMAKIDAAINERITKESK